MTTWFRRPLPFALAAALAACLGCGGPGGSGSAVDPGLSLLTEVADILRAASGGRPPGKFADLAPQERLNPRGYQAIKDGAVIVVYGVPIAGEGEAASGGPVVAYEKDAPNSGGYVVLASGRVQKMTAAEFVAAPKAGK